MQYAREILVPYFIRTRERLRVAADQVRVWSDGNVG